MLPGPGLIQLIARERRQRADQQPGIAGRPQAHIHLVQCPGNRLGIEHVDHPLPQPGEELATLDRSLTIGIGLRITVVDKHQIQIGAMPQLNTADLAITNNDEIQLAARPVGPRRAAVACDHLAPGQHQHLLQDRFRHPGQVITYLHQRQGARNFRSSNAQHVRPLEIAQGFHLLFKIVLGDAQQLLAQLVGQLLCDRWPVKSSGVQQLIQHHRVAGNLLGDPRAGRTQHQQLTQCTRILGQQHQIGRAPRHCLDQGQHALQSQIGIILLAGHGQQPRHEGIQPLAPRPLHGTHSGRAEQILQTLPGRWRFGVASLCQLLQCLLRLQGAIPQRHPVGLARLQLVLVFVRVRNHAGKMTGYTPTFGVKSLTKGLPAGKTEHPRNPRLALRISRQHLRLAVINRLQGVFGITQKAIGIGQFLHCFSRQVVILTQGFQHPQNRPLLKAAVTPSVNQLERLTNKFDLADATRAQFDVVVQALALHLALNHLFERAQRVNRGEVQVTPVDKRPQHRQQLGAGLLITGHHPRLDHGVALPVAPLTLVVLFQRVKAEHQRTAVTIGAQAHVDTEHKAIDRGRIQRLDQLLPQANEKLLIRQAAATAAGLACLGIGKDQVNIGRQIQLDRAQFAHTQYHHVLRHTVTTDRLAEAGTAEPVQPLIGLVDAGVGHIREIPGGFLQCCPAGQVAPDDAYLLPLTKTAQTLRQLLLTVTAFQHLPQQATQLALFE